jgi:hypothetical protein
MNAIRTYYVLSTSTKETSSTQSRNKKNLKTLIRQVATYQAESWTLNKDIANGWLLSKEKWGVCGWQKNWIGRG